MFSTTPSTSSFPPLSYADRAKKASNLKSGINGAPSQRPGPPSKATNIAATTGLQNGASTSTAGRVNASKPTSSVPENNIPAISPAAPPPSAQTTSPTLSRSATDDSGVQKSNSDVSRSEASLMPASQQTASKPAPVVNVWNVRKEQMAQARATTRPLQSLPQNNASHNSHPPMPRNPVSGPAPSSSRIPSGSSISSGTRSQNLAPPSSSNGPSSPQDPSHDDPFVVRPNRAPMSAVHPASNPQPPSVDDAESWPEVGKSVTSAPKSALAQHNGVGQGHHSDERDQTENRDEEASTSHPPTPRKSEKTKWVAIPAEQFFDAPSSQAHSRSHSQYSSGRARNHALGSGAPSHQGSQGTSKAPSGRTSATHSRIHSRASSAHSSPRPPGRGRRLQGDETASADASHRGLTTQTTHTAKSSQNNSPHIYADTTLVAPAPYTPITAETYALGHPSPSQPPHPPVYYMPPPMPPPVQHSPNQSQPAFSPSSGSPFTAVYPLLPPPNGYPSHAMPPPLPPSYVGSPHYPMYPPYPYAYGQPYAYWNGAGERPLYAPYGPVTIPGQEQEQKPPMTGDAEGGLSVQLSSRTQEAGGDEAKGGRQRDVVFGSIGAMGSKSPSPAPQGTQEKGGEKETRSAGEDQDQEQTDEGGERPKQFSIGVAPGEAGPSHVRTRTRSQQAPLDAGVLDGEQGANAGGRAANLTDPHTKWEFGTTMHPGDASPAPPPRHLPLNVGMLFTGPPQGVDHALHPPPMLDHLRLSSPTMDPHTLPLHLPPPPPPPPAPPRDSEWEVKDFGYGFGRPSGAGPAYAPGVPREREFGGRPRRGYGGGYTARGARGRGVGFARGRGFARGGFAPRGHPHQNQHQHQHPPPPPHQVQFQVTPPPPTFQALPHPGTEGVPYYAPPSFGPHVYNAPGYVYAAEQQQPQYVPPPSVSASSSVSSAGPPVPPPLSELAYPLDHTRYYLLGQLEYYLSSQNLAQDFFLRKQMDSRGWIPIALLASFNRVRQLTVDAALVREVLLLSAVVEVSGEHVRMGAGEWRQFVLPDAPASAVEAAEDAEEGEGEGEEEEEEDEVEFVMGKEAGQPWVSAS